MDELNSDNVSRRDKIDAILYAARYKPIFSLFLVALGIIVAVLEGVGLTFIVPIIEIVQSSEAAAQADGLVGMFATLYNLAGIPFTLGYVVVGVAISMSLRYSGSFLYSWLRKSLRYSYQRHLQNIAFTSALDAKMAYFDAEGSDDILNAIITESRASANVLKKILKLLNLVFLTAAYLIIALWVSPLLTLISVGVLGCATLLLRKAVNSGYELGDKVAKANERRHQAAQAGMIGIRDIRIFNLEGEIARKFQESIDQFTVNKVKLKRNESALSQLYNLIIAVFVFVLIYVALEVASLSFGELGLFLFAMFQLGPKVSSMNKRYYSIENELPHLVRTQRFIDELQAQQEPQGGARQVPAEIETVALEDVSFSYTEDEQVLNDVSFSVSKGEFIAFVGESGAGKSTIVSLLTRFYEPDSGSILANGDPIDEMDPAAWREHVAVVRQSPYIFNETLRRNLTVGNRDATQAEIEEACRIARVDEFLDQLPSGYESELGDEGVRLSGGQKQRVALARALLKDADVLVLDEATSNLDTNLEKEVQAAIEAMDRDYAIITIAHRLSTVENADRIYSMQNGCISETGSHDELINSGGKYAELYAIQA